MKLLAALTLSLAVSTTFATDPVEVMVLGTFHLANPGLDRHNMKVDNVLVPEKQAELEDLADRLAKFRPTKIMVEARAEAPKFVSAKYSSLTSEALAQNPDERVQIAFRLAQKLRLQAIHGIDLDGNFPYGPVQEFAQAHGQEALLARLSDDVERNIAEAEAAQKNLPLRLQLARLNEPARLRAEHTQFYYAVLPLGDGKDEPGAALNTGWYERNAKIFARLTHVAQPGDRVLVVYGAGHLFWLRHFVENTPGYALVEANDYLR